MALKAGHAHELKALEGTLRKEVAAEILLKEKEQQSLLMRQSQGLLSKQACDRAITQPYVSHTVINLYS